jgi:hypothetical protein
MELLDATIALAVTLAALATAVTVIMEIFVRIIGLKSKTQIDLFIKIYECSFKERFNGHASDYDFITTILGNPLTTWTATAAIKTTNQATGAQQEVLRTPRFRDVLGTKSNCVYDWVSTEHVFRQLLSLPGVIDESRSRLVANLREFNVEYNQLCAAAKTRFKNNMNNWSVAIGLILALVMNVNALRIYESFMSNPAQTAAMIANMDQLIGESETARAQLRKAVDSSDASGLDEIDQRIELLQQQLGELESTGIPIGWRYAPHCYLVDAIFPPGTDADGKAAPTSCIAEPGFKAGSSTSSRDISVLAAIVASAISGLLIGLGAPFWFDLARRLAQVRSTLKGSGTSDTYAGETPATDAYDYEQRTEKLIDRLVDQALARARKSSAESS